MNIALIADPHLSFENYNHYGVELGLTRAVVQMIIDDINARRPDCVVWLGDVTHEGTDEVRREFARLRSMLLAPDLVLLGNHDIEHATRHHVGQSIGFVRQLWLCAQGWDIVLWDSVRQQSPDNPSGIIASDSQAFLAQTARAASGPLLVMSHHPVSRADMDVEQFWRLVEPFGGRGFVVGGHSHRDWHETRGRWDLIEVASCMTPPAGYRWLELTPRSLKIQAIELPVLGAAPAARAASPFPLELPLD